VVFERSCGRFRRGAERGLGAVMGTSTGSRTRRSALAGAALCALLVGAAQAETTQYTYDALGRVISAIDQSGKKVSYTYDSAGNRTRVSNGQEYTEIIPTAFSSSSNAGTTGLSVAGALPDGDYASLASIHATQTETNPTITADLGSVKNVNHILVAPAVALAVGAGVEDLAGVFVDYSADGTTWQTAASINGAVAGVTQTVALGGVSLRYLRLRRAGSGQVAIGDLRLYSSAAAGSPLIAEPDTIANNGATSVTFNPMANDRSFGGATFAISSVEDPPHGQAINNAGATITYIPDVGYVGGDTFSYTIADGSNDVASAQVFATVTASSAANQAPTAVNDSFSVPDRISATAPSPAALQVLANDFDPDHDILSISSVTTPSHGTATISGGTAVTYAPTVGYAGSDGFSYTISDGRGGSSTATVSLTVANSPPVANSDLVTVDRNLEMNFDPRLNDSDPDGDALTITAVSSPAKGWAGINTDNSVTYTPQANYVGADSFTYTLSDGRGQTATGAVSVTVNAPAAAEVSVMNPATYGGYVNISKSVFTISNRASAKTAVFVDHPITTGKYYWEVKLRCGDLFPGVSANLTWTENNGGLGALNAGIATSSQQTWANATVNSTSIGAGVANDIYGFALDADAHTLQILRNNVSAGTLSLPFSGPYYPHAGSQAGDTITGQACLAGQSAGEFKFGAGSTTYSPPSGYSQFADTAPNSPPVAANDFAYTLTSTAVTFDPRANDTDANGDALTITATSAVSHGALTNSGTSVTYTPTAGYTGSDSFIYALSDGHGGTATATATIYISSATRSFSISPAVSGKTTWNLDTDGPLDLPNAGTWTIVPSTTLHVTAKAWGAGGAGGDGANGAGGGGGYATGAALLQSGVSYKIYVGDAGVLGGSNPLGGAPGGGRGSSYNSDGYWWSGGGGGGYSGLRETVSGASILIAGGGGGRGVDTAGGAGGGTFGEDGTDLVSGTHTATEKPGKGGSQATGGAAGDNSSAGSSLQGGDAVTGSSVLGGGGGGGGYYGGGGGGGVSVNGGSAGAGGGGGSGYFDPTKITGGVLLAGAREAPANANDSDRNGRGQGGYYVAGTNVSASPGHVKLK